jgi:nucleoid-associated protein YgaU
MAKKAANKIQEEPQEEPQKTGNGFFDYLRFGESYTSLILGIIVVVISTALLLSFAHNRTAGNTTKPNREQVNNFAKISAQQLRDLTGVPTQSPDQISTTPVLPPTNTPVPNKEKKQPTPQPTVKPTAKPVATATATPKKVAKASVAPTKAQAKPTQAPKEVTKAPGKDEYIIKTGDTLWSIAEQQYKSGYNWVDIARANNLSNPGVINVGNKLKLPKVVAKTTTVQAPKVSAKPVDQKITTPKETKISGDSYQVVHGDTLWSIAERAYGDGYKWVDIARANHLVNPSLIHSQNKLKIPRGK